MGKSPKIGIKERNLNLEGSFKRIKELECPWKRKGPRNKEYLRPPLMG